MESTIQEFVAQWGAYGLILVVLAWFGYQELNKRDNMNRERIADLKNEVDLIRTESKEDRQIFNRATIGFEKALNEFSGVNSKIENLERDVSYIKNNMNR